MNKDRLYPIPFFALATLSVGPMFIVPGIALPQGTTTIQEAPFGQGQRALGVQGEQYGVLSPAHPLAQRVEGIFAKLVRVSGKRPGAVFEVYLLDTPKIIVQALPGGAVVISRGAVDLTAGDDNALAFLLAHEVAHVIRDHHGLLSSYQQIGVASPSRPAAPRNDEEVRALQAMELEADRLGLLYTSLAGYRATTAGRILKRIIAQTGSSPFHPDPHQRTESLEATIRQITAHVELFYLGLVYLVIGRYEEATRIYETFASLYPSREVYNNLGVAYHKWALLYKRDDGWIGSIAVDARTRAQGTLKDLADLQPQPLVKGSETFFRKYIDRAHAAYRLAMESDPEYAIGHNNLGLAYLEAGEYDFAIGEFKRALRIDSKMASAWNNRGIAYMKNGDTERARTDFLQAIALEPVYPEAHGNLAKLYEITGKKDLAVDQQMKFQMLVSKRPQKSIHAAREAIGGVKVGTEVGKGSETEASGTVSLVVPLAPGEKDALRILINERTGILIASRRERIDVLGAVTGHRGTTGLGIGIGDHISRLERVYGAPARNEKGSWAELSVYPEQGLVFIHSDGRVRSWWLVSENGGRPR